MGILSEPPHDYFLTQQVRCNAEYFSVYLKNCQNIKPWLMFQAIQKILNLLQSDNEFLKVIN